MSGDSVKVAVGLKRSFRRLAIATVVVYLALAAIAIKATIESHETNAALCALKSDLVTRVRQSNQFLQEHPQGFAGISPSVIKAGVENEERTIHALHILSC